MIDRDVDLRHGAGLLVLDRHGGGASNDFILEHAGLLGLRGAPLALGGEPVLVLARDAVAAGDDIGCLDHGQVQFRLVLGDPGIDAGRARIRGAAPLNLRTAFHTACNHGGHAFQHDTPRRHGDSLQAGRAKTVDGDASQRHWQSGADHGLAGNIAPRRTFRITAAQYHVLDQRRIDARPLDGGPYGKRRQSRPRRDIEFAPMRLGQRRPGRGNNDGFSHDGSPQPCPGRFKSLKDPPRSTCSTSSGEGCQKWGSWAANAWISASMTSNPTWSA